MLTHPGVFVYLQFALRIAVKSPQRGLGWGGKGKARTCNGKPDRRFYRRGERSVNSKFKNDLCGYVQFMIAVLHSQWHCVFAPLPAGFR